MTRAPILVLLSSFLLSCSRAGEPSPQETLTIYNGTEPQTLDPGLMRGVPEHRLALSLFEGLTNYDPRDLTKPVPGIAERWDVSKDGLTYTFHLRDARWTNGDPVTAHDFEYAWKRVLDPATASDYAHILFCIRNAKKYYLGLTADADLKGWDALEEYKRMQEVRSFRKYVSKRHVTPLRESASRETNREIRELLEAAAKAAPESADLTEKNVGVHAKDDRTLVVNLEHPTYYFTSLTAFMTYYPVHRAAVKEYGDRWTRARNIVTNGPFRMLERRFKSHILMERNPGYWNAGSVRQKYVKWLAIENVTTAFNLYEAEQIDWLVDVPMEFIEEILKRPDYRTGPHLGTYFYSFNVTKKPLNDVRVRRALAMSVDREQIVKSLTRGGEPPASRIVPPWMPGYKSPPGIPFNPDAARSLLREAGYPEGSGFPRLTVLYNTSEAHKKIAAAVQQMWKDNLGIDVDLQNVEWKTYLEKLTMLDYDIARRGWIGDYLDPMTFIELFTLDSGNNNTGWSHPKFEELVHRAEAELDKPKRFELLRQAEQLFLEEAAIAPFYHYMISNMYRDNIEGICPNIQDANPLHRVLKVSGAD